MCFKFIIIQQLIISSYTIPNFITYYVWFWVSHLTLLGLNVTFFFFVFLGPHARRMKVPRLGVQLEPQLPAYATATATPDPSHVFNLHHLVAVPDPQPTV